VKSSYKILGIVLVTLMLIVLIVPGVGNSIEQRLLISLGSAGGAQLQAPSPRQAPMFLSTLDADGDAKISESEATGGMKQNFAAIDRNSDGGIDLEELTTMLEAASRRRGSPAER
jgi:hypothetical protein